MLCKQVNYYKGYSLVANWPLDGDFFCGENEMTVNLEDARLSSWSDKTIEKYREEKCDVMLPW